MQCAICNAAIVEGEPYYTDIGEAATTVKTLDTDKLDRGSASRATAPRTFCEACGHDL